MWTLFDIENRYKLIVNCSLPHSIDLLHHLKLLVTITCLQCIFYVTNVAIVILAQESMRSCNYVGRQKALNSAKILEHPQKYNSKEDEEREVLFPPIR